MNKTFVFIFCGTIISCSQVFSMIQEGNVPEPSAEPVSGQNLPQKVLIYLKAVGEAPPLPRQKFKLDGSKTLLEIEKFLRKNIGSTHETKSIYLFCGSGFTPGFEQSLQSLFDLFQIGGELIIQYGLQEMWG